MVSDYNSVRLFHTIIFLAPIYGCGALVSIIHTYKFNCLLFVLISKRCRPILLVNVMIFSPFKTWHLCHKVSVDKVNDIFPIGVVYVMGIVQANHQMCMWQTTILVFNHMKCINKFTAIKVFSVPNVHLRFIQP